MIIKGDKRAPDDVIADDPTAQDISKGFPLAKMQFDSPMDGPFAYAAASAFTKSTLFSL
jgi:hypothetical protein